MQIQENKISISNIPLNLAGSHEARQMQNMLYFLAKKFPNAGEKIRLADETKQDLFQALMYSQAPEKLVNNFLGFLLDMNFVEKESLSQLKGELIQAANRPVFFDTPSNLQDSFTSSTSQSLSENNTNQCRMISTQNRLGKELIYSKHQFEKSSPQKKNSKATSEKQHAFVLFKTEVFYTDQIRTTQLLKIFHKKMQKHIEILLTKPSFKRLYTSNDVNLKIPVTVHIVTNYSQNSSLVQDLQEFFTFLNAETVLVNQKKCRPQIVYHNLPPRDEKQEAPEALPAVSVNAAFLALSFGLDDLLADMKESLPFQQNSNLSDVYKKLLELNKALSKLRQTAEQSGEQKDQLAFIRSLQSACEQFDFKIIDELAKVHPSLGQRLQLLKNVADLASDQEYVESGEWIKSKALKPKTTASPEALEINIAALLNKSGFVLEVSAPENSTLYSEINFHLAGIYQFVAENDRMPQLQNQSRWEGFKKNYQPKPNQVLIKPFQYDENQLVIYPDYQLKIKQNIQINLSATTQSIKISCSPYQPQLINRLLAEKIDEKKLSLRQIRELNDFVFLNREILLNDLKNILGIEKIDEEILIKINQKNQILFDIYALKLLPPSQSIENTVNAILNKKPGQFKNLTQEIIRLRQAISQLKILKHRQQNSQVVELDHRSDDLIYCYIETQKMRFQQSLVLNMPNEKEQSQQNLCQINAEAIKNLKLLKENLPALPKNCQALTYQLEQRYLALQWYQHQLTSNFIQLQTYPLIEFHLIQLLNAANFAEQMQSAAVLLLQLHQIKCLKTPLAALCFSFLLSETTLSNSKHDIQDKIKYTLEKAKIYAKDFKSNQHLPDSTWPLLHVMPYWFDLDEKSQRPLHLLMPSDFYLSPTSQQKIKQQTLFQYAAMFAKWLKHFGLLAKDPIGLENFMLSAKYAEMPPQERVKHLLNNLSIEQVEQFEPAIWLLSQSVYNRPDRQIEDFFEVLAALDQQLNHRQLSNQSELAVLWMNLFVHQAMQGLLRQLFVHEIDLYTQIKTAIKIYAGALETGPIALASEICHLLSHLTGIEISPSQNEDIKEPSSRCKVIALDLGFEKFTILTESKEYLILEKQDTEYEIELLSSSMEKSPPQQQALTMPIDLVTEKIKHCQENLKQMPGAKLAKKHQKYQFKFLQQDNQNQLKKLLQRISESELEKSGHTVEKREISGKIYYFKSHKHNDPIFSYYEVVFSKLAEWLFMPGLTPPLVFDYDILEESEKKSKILASKAIVSLDLKHVLPKERLGQEQLHQLITKELEIKVDLKDCVNGYIFLSKLPKDSMKKIFKQAKTEKSKLKLNYAALASVLVISYGLGEDDLHKNNLGFCIIQVNNKFELVFFKIDHDMMFYHAISSKLLSGMRINHLFRHGNFDITCNDILNFPDLRDAELHYWPTQWRVFSKGDKAYQSFADIEAFVDLKTDPEFMRQAQLVFLKILIFRRALSKDKLYSILPKEQSYIVDHVYQAFLTRSLMLENILFSTQTFRIFLNETKEISSLIDEIAEQLAVEENLVKNTFKMLRQQTKMLVDSDTPLHVAIKLNNFFYDETLENKACEKALLIENENGEDPLLLACQQENKEMISYLLSIGAKPSAKHLALCLKNQRPNLLVIFEKYFSKPIFSEKIKENIPKNESLAYQIWRQAMISGKTKIIEPKRIIQAASQQPLDCLLFYLRFFSANYAYEIQIEELAVSLQQKNSLELKITCADYPIKIHLLKENFMDFLSNLFVISDKKFQDFNCLQKNSELLCQAFMQLPKDQTDLAMKFAKILFCGLKASDFFEIIKKSLITLGKRDDLTLKQKKQQAIGMVKFAADHLPLHELQLAKKLIEEATEVKYLQRLTSKVWLERKLKGAYGETSTYKKILHIISLKLENKLNLKNEKTLNFSEIEEDNQQFNLIFSLNKNTKTGENLKIENKTDYSNN